jgi:hypothetical protein
MQALLVLKEEENLGLSNILNSERDRVKSLLHDLAEVKKRSNENEEKLKVKQGECSEMQKTLGRLFNNMTVIKKNVNHWLGSESGGNGSGYVASVISNELNKVKAENLELKSRIQSLQQIVEAQENQLVQVKQREERNDILFEYLKSARNSENKKNPSPKNQNSEKNSKKLDYSQEDIPQTHQKIEDLLKENERLRQICIDFDEKRKKNSRFSSDTSRNFEEYECNIKILKENNNLLLEKIKSLETQKSKLIQDYKNENKITAEHLSSLIISSYNSDPDSQQVIQENLCRLWQSNESIFSVSNN